MAGGSINKETIETNGTYAVITGAASGIGRELARQTVALGCNVALADVSAAPLHELATELEERGARVLARVVDIRSAAAMEEFAVEVFDFADAPVVYVFANAGIHGYDDAFDPDLELWDRVFDVNVKGALHTSRSFLQRLIDQNVPAQFAITISHGAFTAAPGMAPYIASKHAVWGLADCLRKDVERLDTPVGVSVIAPSRCDTGMLTPRIEALRNDKGQEAAEAYRAQMVGPDVIVKVLLREITKREFWIIPSHEPIEEDLVPRIDELLGALPAGRFDKDKGLGDTDGPAKAQVNVKRYG